MQEAEDFDIHFIDKNLESLLPPPGSRVASRDVALAALAMVLRELPPVEAEVEAVVEGGSIWDGGGAEKSAALSSLTISILINISITKSGFAHSDSTWADALKRVP